MIATVDISGELNHAFSDPKGFAFKWFVILTLCLFAYKLFMALLADNTGKALAVLTVVFLGAFFALGLVDGGAQQMVDDGRASMTAGG